MPRVIAEGVFGEDDIGIAGVGSVIADEIRYGFVFELPFRLRVPAITRLPAVDVDAEVWLHNRIDIPVGTDLPQGAASLKEDGGVLWTEAVVFLTDLKMDEKTIEAVRERDFRTLEFTRYSQ